MKIGHTRISPYWSLAPLATSQHGVAGMLVAPQGGKGDIAHATK